MKLQATTLDFQNLVTKVNTVLSCDTSWDMQTAFIALIGQTEKFENIFISFEDETFVCGEVYDFTLECENVGEVSISIFQAYEDIRKLSVEF